MLFFDQLDGNAVLFQELCKIKADAPAAAEDDLLRPAGDDPQIFEQHRQVCPGGPVNENAVPPPEDKIAVRRDRRALRSTVHTRTWQLTISFI